MQLRGSKQAAAAGGAVIAALALAACSSSSSRRQARPPRRRSGRVLGRGGSALERGRGERHHQRERARRSRRTSSRRPSPAFKSVQPGITVNYGGGGSGTGRSDLYVEHGAVRRLRLADPGHGEVQGSRGQDRAVLPGADRPDRHRLQPVRRHRPEAGRDRPSRGIFQGKITTWNDPAIKALNSGRQPAEHPDHPGGPLGLLRHHGELLQVPGRRGGQRLEARHAPPPSPGRRPPTPPTAAAAWPRPSSPPRAPSATSTSRPPPPPA